MPCLSSHGLQRRVVAITLTLFILALLAGPIANANKVKIQVLDAWGPGPWQHGLYSDWSEALAERFPHIEVEFIPVLEGSSAEKLMVMIAAGIAPDVSLVSEPQFAVQGHVLNLKPFFDRDPELQEMRFWPSSIEYNTMILDGEPFMWGIPGNPDSRPIWVNVDIFDELGIEYRPEVPWTWDEFANNARRMTRTDGNGEISRWGFALPLDWPFNHFPYVWSNGGEMLERHPDTGWVHQAVANQPATIEAFDWLYSLMQRQIAPPWGVNPSFHSGQVVMTQSWSSIASTAFEFRADVMPTPVPAPGMPSINIANGSSMGSIIASTPHPQEAWEVLKFLAGEEGDGIRIRHMPHPPAVMNSRYLEFWREMSGNFRADIFLDQIAAGRLGPWSKIQVGTGDVTRIFQEELGPFWQGQVPASEATANIDRRVNAFLQEQLAQ